MGPISRPRRTMSSMRPLRTQSNQVSTRTTPAQGATQTHLALINAPVAPLCLHPNPVKRAATADPKNLPQNATAITQTTQPQMMPELSSVRSVRRPEVALVRCGAGGGGGRVSRESRGEQEGKERTSKGG